MASNVKELQYSEKDVEYVRKLVYDVLVYTLQKYGIPASTERPPTDYEENVYNRANFVEIAGLSALRISLLLRDRWKRMFTSRHKSSGFKKENIVRYLNQVIILCPLSWNDTQQSAIEVSLALCNELLLFFHHETIDFDSNVIMDSISIYILSVIASNRNVSETVEKLIGKIDNVSDYDKWITEFIANFAISYESKGVSDYFFEYVQAKWKADTEKDDFPEILTLEELRDYMGFLPDDLFAVIAYEDEDDIPEKLAQALESILPSDQESSNFEKLPTISEDRAVEEESPEMQQTRSAKDSAKTAQDEGSSKTSEQSVEKALEQMSLGAAEVSQECHGAIPKQKKSKKKKRQE